MKFLRPAAIIVAVLALDQTLKFWIKLHYTYNESKKIFEWFYIYFIENEGMAFGMTWGGESGKLMLSLFRLIAVILIGVYIVRIVNRNAHPGFVASMALIFAGATGNIIDSVFYGQIFSASVGDAPAVLFPDGGGYAPLLHGRVVDMLYFPLFEGFLPKWVPMWGGDYFIFFRPIFNIADASITTGVLLIILFQKRFFKPEPPLSDTPVNSAEVQSTQPEN
ncbi:MAG: lipoprotein signal peptidase [Bacteroidetes bacterium]|nr:lipoprotein signal peptidase [Bacteroidota bacterium]